MVSRYAYANPFEEEYLSKVAREKGLAKGGVTRNEQYLLLSKYFHGFLCIYVAAESYVDFTHSKRRFRSHLLQICARG